MTDPTSNADGPLAIERDPYAALRERDFRLFLSGNFLWVLGFKMQSVAVGYEIFKRTEWPLALGLIGLVQIVPVLALALIAGHVADRYDRRLIILTSLACTALASLGLAFVSLRGSEVWAIYLLVMITGVARGFSQPARAAFLPQIVSRDRFPNAITWSTGAFQLAFVMGPALGGLTIAAFAKLAERTGATNISDAGPAAVYLCYAVLAAVFFGMLSTIRSRPVTPTSEGLTAQSLAAGAKFVWSQKVMLGALSLDLFAVLLGGAAALLPIYASDKMLNVGPIGLGWMEAAPALGAVLMTIVMAHRPPMERAGSTMLWSVAGFGVATIVFGVSKWFPLSLAMLFVAGALDTISVVIRHTLVQLLTPDAMRGRVSAINGMFIGASNELGAFESGAVADLAARLSGDMAFGAAFSVVSGGIGTVLVVSLLYVFAPTLRRYGRLVGPTPAEEQTAVQEPTAAG
ncbi:MAG TPA: MFS transporter [Pirellulales bacterium]|jgi:MFS family permease